MQQSNIVAQSNVYPFKKDLPWYDSEFVSQVEDYTLLKKIFFLIHTVEPTPKQEEIMRTETRCMYAKNDPCWGYSDKAKKAVCACINGKCPKGIYLCNPNYTDEDRKYWKTSKEDKALYGNPKNRKELPYYYLVDLISEEEMQKYDENAANDYVWKHPVDHSDKDKDSSNDKEYMIDPVTGKKMVVVGYEWKTTDNSYDTISLVSIWGFVDEIEETKKPIVVKRAKKIEKLKKVEPLKKSIFNSDLDREKVEKSVLEKITDTVKLIDLTVDQLKNERVVMFLDNPAELSFVSSTFVVSGIEHGIISDSNIRLALIEDINNFSDIQTVLVSSTVIKNECNDERVMAWDILSKKSKLLKLEISEREYYLFNKSDISRWTCRNMYGVTHVCVEPGDIEDFEKLQDGLYQVSIVEGGKSYMISDKNGNPLANLNKKFSDLIEALKNNDEISGTPAVIKGITLKINNGKIDILGMGHLKFVEY